MKKIEGAIADRRTCRGCYNQFHSRRRTKPSPWLNLHQLVKVISKVSWLHSDRGTPLPPADTRFVPGFTTSEVQASSGRFSCICGSDKPRRSGQTEFCLADIQECRSPATQWVEPRPLALETSVLPLRHHFDLQARPMRSYLELAVVILGVSLNAAAQSLKTAKYCAGHRISGELHAALLIALNEP